ncbi:heavy-metal-associated domain-containing protein [Candidatus Woesearchaeota archaeon]|nr:heavy-metal-associated domain-containing protein [Candidatus Woesearchaeota archaeon]
MKTIWTVKGTHCNACKMLIEDVCSETKGVTSSTLDFKSGKLVIEHNANADLKALKKEIEKVGAYKVSE